MKKINIPYKLTTNKLLKLFKPIEQNDLLVSRIWLNVQNYSDLFANDRSNTESKWIIDPIHQREILKTGNYAIISNTKLYVSKKIPKDHIVIISNDQGDIDLDPNWIPSKFTVLKERKYY